MSKTKNTYYLTGNVTAEAPLATCGPSLAAAAKKINKNGPTPIPTFVNDSGRVMYMPGAGFRSKLRGAACALMLEALEERGAKRFSLPDAQLNRVGGIKQSGAEPAINAMAYLAMIEANPILGIFGASTPWVKGKAQVGHLTCKNPNLEPMVVDGVRADVIRRDPGIVEFLEEGALDQYSADIERTRAYSALKVELKELTKQVARAKGDEKKALITQLNALEKKIKDGDLKQVSAQQPLGGYEAIPQGAELDNKIALVGVSQIELGCFLAAMQRFAETPVLGAHVAHGAGVISGTWSVQKVGTGPTPIGSIVVAPFVGLDFSSDPADQAGTTEFVDAIKAFRDFIRTDACIPYVNMAAMMPATTEEGSDE